MEIRIKSDKEIAGDINYIKEETPMVTNNKELRNMTTEELQELKKGWYQQAKEDGSLDQCYVVCTMLGERLNARYGPKYHFQDDENNLELYVDNWGKYFTAEWKGKRVMSTHPCDKLFIPGDWMEVVNTLYPFALEKDRKEKKQREEKQQQQMVAELTLP